MEDLVKAKNRLADITIQMDILNAEAQKLQSEGQRLKQYIIQETQKNIEPPKEIVKKNKKE